MSGTTEGYVHRRLNVTFTLGTGDFGEAGSQNTVTLSGLRISASVSKAGGPTFTSAQLRVFGMSLSHMNQLSTLGKPLNLERKNAVTLQAGVEGGAMSTVFSGNMRDAWADMNASPRVPFLVTAVDGGLEAIKPVVPNSYQGAVDVATVMTDLARLGGYTLENNGVTQIMSNSYLSGTITDQIKAVAEHAGIRHIIENGTLAIWPKNGSRGGLIPLINKSSGMVGYPSYTAGGIVVKTLYNPSIQFGGKIKVESIVEPANGQWVVFSVVHDLDSETPNGQWFTTLYCNQGETPTRVK